METTAVAPWFGSSRMIGRHVGEECSGLSWMGIPFGGGMCELAHIDCRTIVVSDKHSHVINLARCIADPSLCRELCRQLDRLPFHPEVLRAAQENCRNTLFDGDRPFLPAAVDYFASVWMGRSGFAGTEREFNGNLSVRWTSSGGDSNTRYRSAIRSIVQFHRIMKRCSFSVLDCFEFLDECKDQEGHGIYCDPPWPDDGDKYAHKFTKADHIRLSNRLSEFRKTRVVIRYGDHPLIQHLYPEDCWTWREITGRTQGNNDKSEVLIINGPSRMETNNKSASKGLFA